VAPGPTGPVVPLAHQDWGLSGALFERQMDGHPACSIFDLSA
jgi:hypothetical protein